MISDLERLDTLDFLFLRAFRCLVEVQTEVDLRIAYYPHEHIQAGKAKDIHKADLPERLDRCTHQLMVLHWDSYCDRERCILHHAEDILAFDQYWAVGTLIVFPMEAWSPKCLHCYSMHPPGSLRPESEQRSPYFPTLWLYLCHRWHRDIPLRLLELGGSIRRL